MNNFQTIIGIGIGIVFMVVGGILIPTGYKELKNAQESLKWSITDGIIISSEIIENQNRSTTYEANVRYKYIIGEKSYLSEQVSFGQDSSNDLEHARSIVRRYETGEKISVHFNPANPSQSVLEPGVSWGSYTLLINGTFFFFFGAISTISSGFIIPKQQKRRTEAIKQVASILALTFLEEDKTLQQEDFFQLPWFQHRSSRVIRNILRKRNADGKTILFDYEFIQDKNQRDQTVAAFQVSNRNLPEFRLRPKNSFDNIGAFFGRQDINFESQREFSQCYRLRGEVETAIRELFNFNILQFFSQTSGWWIEGKGEWLVIYQINRQIEPEELSTFLMQTTQISQLFS